MWCGNRNAVPKSEHSLELLKSEDYLAIKRLIVMIDATASALDSRGRRQEVGSLRILSVSND